ncbi:MAG: glycosyltransferase [Rickettsia endosymbiont of Argas persicus]
MHITQTPKRHRFPASIISHTVLLRDLSYFKKLDMSNYIAAGSMDTALTYNVLKIDTKCNRDISSAYKNSGVIFFNLENLREKQAKNSLSEAIQNSQCEFSFPDQDLLNIAFHNYMYPLTMRWNFCTYFKSKSPYFSYFILHYAGFKPWTLEKQKLWETNPEKLNEITKYYWRYRELTPWGN